MPVVTGSLSKSPGPVFLFLLVYKALCIFFFNISNKIFPILHCYEKIHYESWLYGFPYLSHVRYWCDKGLPKTDQAVEATHIPKSPFLIKMLGWVCWMGNWDELLCIREGQTWALMAQSSILGLLSAVETSVCDQPQSWKALLGCPRSWLGLLI